MARSANNAGTNTSFFLSGATAYLTWQWWPESPAFFGHQMLAWTGVAVAATAALGGAKTYAHTIRNRRALHDSREAGINHGSAREATEAELEARGMFEPSSGNFLGLKYSRAVFAPKDAPFSLYEAPPGSGKDIYFAVGNILHRSLLGYSVFAPDVKLELGPMLIPGLKAVAQGDFSSPQQRRSAWTARKRMGTVDHLRQSPERDRHPQQRTLYRPADLEQTALCEGSGYRQARVAPQPRKRVVHQGSS